MESNLRIPQTAPVLKEVRCRKCNKKLGEFNGYYEIKCPRCGNMQSGYIK
ncbi:Com family DNA-binding transcriptional regulator [Caproicibacterium amylolyticum]|uniref:Com family DNA-binding transcriptional regulator n=1 Tax=Caproicibacterium amylolyticum TaxID=2766537 RepID=A0A7G9WJY5_9FIRM|nr:Com family DNA-binding transcriptional regulator [Caproicibacterium amylolyticum]